MQIMDEGRYEWAILGIHTKQYGLNGFVFVSLFITTCIIEGQHL